MTKKSKHTKARWSNNGLEIRDKNTGMIIANVYKHLPANQSREEAEANALRIVKAVNAYDELVDTLKTTLYAFKSGRWTEDTYNKIEAVIEKNS